MLSPTALTMCEKRPFAYLDIPDRFIEKPVKPELGAVVVVPVFKEYSNGNIFRLIDTFSRQTADSKSFEVLCVVNNPRHHAQEETPAYQENQQTLELGKYVTQGATIPEAFPPYQRSVLKRAQDYGLSLHMIDATFGGVEGNMGIARQVGVIEAEKRLAEAGKPNDGVITHLDADTLVERSYIEKVLETFESGIESTAFQYDYIMPNGTEELFKTAQTNDRKGWYYRLNLLLLGQPTVSTPQLAATASAHKITGGVPLRNCGEDVSFFDNLRKQTTFSSTPHITVYASDRARPESFDGRGRYHKLGHDNDLVCTNPSIDLVRKAVGNLKYAESGEIPDIDHLKTLLRKLGLNADLDLMKPLYDIPIPRGEFFEGLDRIIRKQGESQTNMKPLEWGNHLIEIFNNFMTSEERHLLGDLLGEERRKQKLRHVARVRTVKSALACAVMGGGIDAIREQSLKYEEFLSQNSWMRETLQNLLEEGGTSREMFAKLEEQFPGFLEEWTEDLQGATALFKGLINFVMKTRHEPTKYTGVSQVLSLFSSPLAP